MASELQKGLLCYSPTAVVVHSQLIMKSIYVNEKKKQGVHHGLKFLTERDVLKH